MVTLQYFRRQWKSVTIICLEKSGKPPIDPSSYPVAEKIIYTLLEDFTDKYGKT